MLTIRLEVRVLDAHFSDHFLRFSESVGPKLRVAEIGEGVQSRIRGRCHGQVVVNVFEDLLHLLQTQRVLRLHIAIQQCADAISDGQLLSHGDEVAVL
jgi:hypothetical protein